MDEYCREKGFAGWFETSAKDNINIDDAAKFLVGTVSMFFIGIAFFFSNYIIS
jgi:Ras-related protein Rab-32